MSPEQLAEWRAGAERDQRSGFGLGWPSVVLRLVDALEDMTREAHLSREATEKAVRTRIARHELERAFRAADAPEDSMATEGDVLRWEGRAEAVAIMRDMLGLVGEVCRAPGYNGVHVAVGAGAVGSPPYVCHGCGGTFTPTEDQ